LLDGELAWRRHDGGHENTSNMRCFIAWANKLTDSINRNLAGMADGRSVRYLDINDKPADQEGRWFPGMLNAEQLHPALKAYQAWADVLEPVLTEVLGHPAITDDVPPPAGDLSVRRSPEER